MNINSSLYGAATGDICGSTYEFCTTKNYDFKLLPEESHFTDDSLLTAAIANAIMTDTPYLDNIVHFGTKYSAYPVGFGSSFRLWLHGDSHKPYNSWGNGSAMRVSPVGWAFSSIEEVLEQARLTAKCTHNHPEGVKGAQAVAVAIYLARTGSTKETIKSTLSSMFSYDLNRTVENIRPTYSFEVSCQKSVPEAIICFLDSRDYESAIRNAVSLGGDADTQAAIAGSIAEAFYTESVPTELIENTFDYLPYELYTILTAFGSRFKS